jgi:PAS domain S-box-containing protein
MDTRSYQNRFETVLEKILAGTATETGETFFSALVANLASALEVPAAWVTEYTAAYRKLKTLAFWLDGRLRDDMETSVKGTPCEVVINDGRILHVAEHVAGEFPDDPDLAALGIVSYMGVPFRDARGQVLGHLAVMDRKPMPEKDKTLAIMHIFAARAAAELRRIRAETGLIEREQRLSLLLNTAPDVIVELDDDLCIRLINAEAEKALKVSLKEAEGKPVEAFLTPESFKLLNQRIGHMSASGPPLQKQWVPEYLSVRCADGSGFKAEATMSQYREDTRQTTILMLRNIDERLAAETAIQALRIETRQLKEELSYLTVPDDIVGSSKPFLNVLKDVDQVANTDAVVLISGETGTGKELISRMVHAASGRKDMPLIKINCAAIPAGLMESELFGHRKGAFTGASRARQGRFGLADRGTILLDEIAELPLDLQPKLLRVLQEGEFEPVGSSQTCRVDVRVIAATNKDLARMTDEGNFRQDLYYRLNVFPIVLPPLRERGDDIIELAAAFIERFGRRLGRSIDPLSAADILRLKTYPWPGNIRELQNIIERAVITAKDGRLDLIRCLPVDADPPQPEASAADLNEPVLTDAQVKDIEKANIVKALEISKWRVSGKNGAATLLGIPSSTLNSRIKALKIDRSHR